MNCYWYYSWDIWTYWWIYFVIVLGIIFCFAITGCIIACCVRSRRARYRGQDTIIINDSPSPYNNGAYNNTAYNNTAYNNNNNTWNGQNNNVTYMGEPVYLSGNQTNQNPNNLYWSLCRIFYPFFIYKMY